MPVVSAMKEIIERRIDHNLRPASDKNVRPYLKNNKSKEGQGKWFKW
jgi:hypothetical protein